MGGLTALPASDLRTLLLHVFRARAAARPLRDIARQFRDQAVCSASPIDARTLHRIEGMALDALPADVEAVDLAPVVPLGAQNRLGGTPQDNVLSAGRQTELVGDPTVQLALELALRPDGVGALAARHRATRMQPLRTRGHTQHFALFALATGGLSAPREQLETSSLREHLGILLRLLAAAKAHGAAWKQVEVRISDLSVNRALASHHGIDVAGTPWQASQAAMHGARVEASAAEPVHVGVADSALTVLGHVHERVTAGLQEAFPSVSFRYDFTRTRQATYYTRLAFHIRVDALDGPIADGGFVDWGQRLLGNRKHRLLTSGVGLQLVAALSPRS